MDYVLCLDSIGGSNELFMHVSKPPKENTPGYRLVEAFKEVSFRFKLARSCYKKNFNFVDFDRTHLTFVASCSPLVASCSPLIASFSPLVASCSPLSLQKHSVWIFL